MLSSTVQNAGDAEIQGIEWSTQFHVSELMSLGFNANFTDTEFTKLDPNTTAVRVGGPLDNVPKYSYSINADFDFNWSSSTAGFAHINFNKQGPSTTTDLSFAPLTLESSGLNLLNAQIGAEWQQLTVRVFGRNLTNELRAINPSLLDLFSQNRPRTLGVSASYEF
jgi:outer membrane receptor protein involved in Fe transport